MSLAKDRPSEVANGLGEKYPPLIRGKSVKYVLGRLMPLNQGKRSLFNLGSTEQWVNLVYLDLKPLRLVHLNPRLSHDENEPNRLGI